MCALKSKINSKMRLKQKLSSTLKTSLLGNKYGNKPINGFDSTSEYYRWCFLSSLAKSGEISNLKKHVLYKYRDGTGYEADFTYIKNGKLVVEDVKSPALRYQSKFLRNKSKMKIEYNINVLAIHPKSGKIY